MTNAVVDSLTETVEQMATELESLRKELKTKQQREKVLVDLLEAYGVTLQSEIEKNGGRLGDEIHAIAPLHRTDEAGSGEQQEGSKTDFIRDVIKSAPNGITAVDVWKRITQSGLSMRRNYLYAVLNRLVEKKECEFKGQKYFFLKAKTVSE